MKIRSMSELLALQPPAEQFLLDPQLLAVGGSMFIYGSAETFKSWLGLHVATAIAGGNKWLEMYQAHQRKVLVIQSEQSELMYRTRVVKHAAAFPQSWADNVGPNLDFMNEVDMKLDTFAHLASLGKIIQDNNYSVILLDNLYRSLSAATTDEVAVQRWLDGLSALQQKYKVAFVIIHHARKEQSSDEPSRGFEDMTGTARFGYWADTIVRSKIDSKRDDRIVLSFEKQKNAEVRLDDVRLTFRRDKADFYLM